MKKYFIVLCGFVLFCFTGCLEMKQEIWVNADGSGRFTMDIGIDKSVYEQLTNLGKMSNPDAKDADMFGDIIKQKDDMLKNPDIIKADVQQFDKDDTKHLMIDISVKDFNKLSDLDKLLNASKEGKDDQKQVTDDSQFSFTKIDAKSFDFLLVLKAKKADTNPEAEGTNQMMQTMFAGKQFVTTLHAPQIISSNGEKVDDHTVRWSMLMTDRIAQTEDKSWQAKVSLGEAGFFQGMVDKMKSWF